MAPSPTRDRLVRTARVLKPLLERLCASFPAITGRAANGDPRGGR